MQSDDPKALTVLLERYSVGARHLRAPAPSEDELTRMVAAALRAPDHAGLVPYRFALVQGDARERLGELFQRVALAAGKSPEQAERDRERATGVPMLVAVIAHIDAGHPLATVHEQWIAIGGALANFLTAAHALGYGGKMLSGGKVRVPEVVAAFCRPGETLVGWVVLGTPQGQGKPKFDKPAPGALIERW
ncbi:MAG: nitroreductase [Hydrogenophaga sp.]|uniref:nitroreductase family protein n=1 Tax=Hydrogenophaga sp. TaxID=1904254 RepID=UPI001DD83975|nr:nitroreductase [Hydrogenophaga sp.]MBX3611339.1 nitroreductase [Hydrogenophaga sp.]